MSLTIRPMTLADMQRALDWAAAEGWNPGLDDAEVFLAQDPDGCLMGWLGDEPVACITVVNYGEAFAFLGLYIVHPQHRGLGHGKAIWTAGMAHAGSRTIGLDGVPAQQENYRRLGFAYAYTNARFSGVCPVCGPVSPHVKALGPADIEAVARFDRRWFAGPRDHFLAAWLAGSTTRITLGHYASGTLDGYGTIRRCRSGWKVGPLFADTSDVAETLVVALVAVCNPPELAIDIPATNGAAVELARALGLTPAFETARMYRGDAPAVPAGTAFGVTTLELG